ncbi:MAG: DUF5615 family PIN-like protein [Spirochaetia bacterium]|nr:DUF5615 family PIN-like protein [Spirochaetia bacterium]
MKILIDENISIRIKEPLSKIFKEITHVRDINLQNVDDKIIWDYAKQHQYAIISKDSDFHHKSLLYGFPPKIIWITTGNCSTNEMIILINKKIETIKNFIEDTDSSILIL